MFNPHISIILPVHNGGAYLAEALKSVLSQTYPHFSLIVLENASTDETNQILSEIKDPRITIFPSKRLLSIGENWSRATSIDLASYVTFLSHDDFFAPDYLKTIVALIEQHPDARVFTTHFDLIDSNGSLLRPSKPIPYVENDEEYLLATQQHQRDSYGTGYVMQSDRFMEIGGIPQLPNLMFADDLLIFSMIQDGGYKVCDPSTQFHYRYHGDSMARLTTLEIIFDAGVQYLDYLDHTSYMNTPEHRKLAQRYVKDILVRRHRALLAALLISDDNQHVEYDIQMKNLRHDASWSGDQDAIVTMFRFLLNMPSIFRPPLATLIKSVASLTWQFRNRR